ncbi:unnamed protein product, partial [Phaeothamnion confervicola]
VREEYRGASTSGQILWSSAIILSRFLHRHAAAVVAGKDVLEIGAGLGLCGVVAAFHARRVV